MCVSVYESVNVCEHVCVGGVLEAPLQWGGVRMGAGDSGLTPTELLRLKGKERRTSQPAGATAATSQITCLPPACSVSEHDSCVL